MNDRKTEETAAPSPSAGGAPADPRPAYEPPRLARKRAVTRATLFSGGGPIALPPLLPDG